MNGGGAKWATFCGQCAEGKPLTQKLFRIWKIMAITVVGPTTTDILLFPSFSTISL